MGRLYGFLQCLRMRVIWYYAVCCHGDRELRRCSLLRNGSMRLMHVCTFLRAADRSLINCCVGGQVGACVQGYSEI